MFVIHMLLNIKFILASNSASRKLLLKNAGLSFFIEKPFRNRNLISDKIFIKCVDLLDISAG